MDAILLLVRKQIFWFVIVVIVLAVSMTSCTEAAGTTTQNLPEVTFNATEYAYEGPANIPGGWTRINFDNQGELAHDLMLLKLADGKTADDVLAALEAEGPPDWAGFYGFVAAQPGEQTSYVVDLSPGKYVMLSFGAAEEGPPDAFQGMVKDLDVSEPGATLSSEELPAANAQIDLLDFSFAISGDIQAGEVTMRVNNSGKELHELYIYKMKPGYDLVDFRAYLERSMTGEMPPGEPIFEGFGGTLNSPGVSTFINQNFEAGRYIFICHLPSPANEMQPHFQLGMIQEVVVQ